MDCPGAGGDDICVVDCVRHQDLPSLGAVAGVVIAGSHAMVTDDLDWSLALEAWVPELIQRQIPLLGICYGHQLLARAMGGKVGFHPQGIEIGTREIQLTPAAREDLLFSHMPWTFWGQTTHSQTVLALPPGGICLAQNEVEPHHAFRVGPMAWGVQFHPEYTAPIMAAYVDEMKGVIRSENKNYGAIKAGVGETPKAAGLLPRFAQLCFGS